MEKQDKNINNPVNNCSPGWCYRLLNKNIKEFNKVKLSIICIVFLLSVGFISYKINSSYALFSDSITGAKTIEATVDMCSQNKPNAPVLDSSMIPVYYDEDTETWKKADSTNKSNNWYDYCDKKWANSVTVSSTNRSKYQSASVGTEIPMDDILTMQVWIPRYKYKVWNYNADGTKTSNEQEIEITFEKGTAKTGEIECQDAISGTEGDPSETCKLKDTNETCTDDTCNNKTYTHPAFTFGDEEIKGFWIGKFELTGTIDNITTKPDVQSLRNQKVSSFETNIMNMKNSGNSYGFSTSTDTHIIKSSEWGAVAYLSHSRYGTCADGTCKEVNTNNSPSYYTGSSRGIYDEFNSAYSTYKYNQTKNTVTEMVDEGTNITPTITNDTTYPWTEENGLYKSTTYGRNTNTTNLTFNFTAPTNNTYLSFDWSASTIAVSNNYLYYTITKDGTTLPGTGTSTKIGGTTLGTTESSLKYKSVSRQLEAGTYKLTFTYKKTLNRIGGTDTAYIKNIKVLDGPVFKDRVVELKSGEDGPSASTTHNIYGVYDMNGGAYENTMGNMISPDGTTMMSGAGSSNNSGYSGILYDLGNYTSYTGIAYPDSKYYDKYSFDKQGTHVIRYKLGDGIKEVKKQSKLTWYSYGFSDNAIGSMWFMRDRIFGTSYSTGVANSSFSSRLIITP